MLAFVVLIMLGIALGWLLAIVAGTEAIGALSRNLAAGVVGSIIGAGLAAGRSPWGSVRAETLLAGLVGAALALALLHGLRRSYSLPI